MRILKPEIETKVIDPDKDIKKDTSPGMDSTKTLRMLKEQMKKLKNLIFAN